MQQVLKRKYWTMLVAAGAAVSCGTMAAYAAGFTLPAPAKIAFLYFAEKNDGGWTQAFDEARPKIEAAVGMKIPFVEKVPEVAGQITPAAEQFIQRGYNVIIGTAFGYSDTFKELSQKYPKVAFLNASGTTNGSNLESFYGRTYESQYLCGMIAGGMSKSGKLGFVAAHPIGPVNWTINAYELGAQKINPKATVTVIFTGAWNDPVKER
ncbi:MAG TPA: BMP family ABC transporter substrate-binding protein, partial [Methylocella sp.]|nr:BMP family ABC transporter substrate-binding protein [Methylocella sp.]